MLYYDSHNIYRAKFCVTAFLCPTIDNLDIQSCSLYIVTWLDQSEKDDEIMHNVIALLWDRDVF